jgi:uncharacterized protein YegL
MTTQPNEGHSGQRCLPAYAVLDTSGSMRPYQQLLNDSLERVYDGLVINPAVAEFAHMSIVSFNTDAHVVLPLTDVSTVTQLPRLTCGGSTNYTKAFRLIETRINEDVTALKAQGRPVLRPAVFFITDGEPKDPADEWRQQFAALTSPSWSRRPHVITFGFGKAAEPVLKKIATKAAFKAETGLDDRDALVNVLRTMLDSLIASARNEKLMIPTEVEGYKEVPLEYVD